LDWETVFEYCARVGEATRNLLCLCDGFRVGRCGRRRRKSRSDIRLVLPVASPAHEYAYSEKRIEGDLEAMISDRLRGNLACRL
jgi:hypothetical protein